MREEFVIERGVLNATFCFLTLLDFIVVKRYEL
jgi:hypothetical protein